MRIAHLGSTMYQLNPKEYFADLEALFAIDADVCVVAGDFSPDLVQSVAALRPVFERMPVVYVPGNLDFYNGQFGKTSIEDWLARAGDFAASEPNLHLLYNSAADIDGVRFIGTTLWTRLDRDRALGHHEAINDFKRIRTNQGPWSIGRQNLEADIAQDFLASELMSSNDIATVVVTHNIPSKTLADPKYARSRDLDQFFMADMDGLLESGIAPDHWIFGTGSQTYDRQVGNTLVSTNARGHKHNGVWENPDFVYGAKLDVTPRNSPEASARI